MADWRRRSLAGGPSPSTPNGDIPGALHLDFFSSAEADGDSKMAVASPANTDEGSPLQPRQFQPFGTAATGGGGSRRRLSWGPDDSGGRVSSPSSSQLPPLTDHVSFVNDEAGEEEKETMSLYCDEVLDDNGNDDDGQAMSSGRSGEEGGYEGISLYCDEVLEKETMSLYCDEVLEEDDNEDDGQAMPSGRSGEEVGYEGISPGRGEEDDYYEDDRSVPCVGCGAMKKLMMLMPCRHFCYCAVCYKNAWGTPPCPICSVIKKNLGPKKSR